MELKKRIVALDIGTKRIGVAVCDAMWFGASPVKLINRNNVFDIRFGIVLLLDHYINDNYIDDILNICKKINNDNYYVIGQSVYSNTKIGNKDGGALINKYDKNGELIWSKTFGNSKNAIYNDIVLKDNYGWNLIGYLTDEDGREMKINWKWLYGSLDKGHYRIVKSITLSPYVREYFSVEFDIE